MLGKYYQRIMVTAFPGLKSLALEPNYKAFQLSLQSWENLILVTHSENTQKPGLPVHGCWFLCLLGGQLGMDVRWQSWAQLLIHPWGYGPHCF